MKKTKKKTNWIHIDPCFSLIFNKQLPWNFLVKSGHYQRIEAFILVRISKIIHRFWHNFLTKGGFLCWLEYIIIRIIHCFCMIFNKGGLLCWLPLQFQPQREERLKQHPWNWRHLPHFHQDWKTSLKLKTFASFWSRFKNIPEIRDICLILIKI